MIYCLPFTFYTQEQLRILTGMGERLVLLYPARGLIGRHTEAWVDRGALRIQIPAGVDEALLDRLLREYRRWADLHQGNLEQAAEFFRSGQSLMPLVDETDPTQIITQVRRFGRPDTAREDRAVLQAALFMAMAHDYDANHDAVSKDLAAVIDIEKQMYTGLAGDWTETDEPLPAISATAADQPGDPGLYLTDTRIQAWATLACAVHLQARLHLTTSRAVFDSLCEAFPQAVALLEWHLDVTHGSDGDLILDDDQRARLKALAFARDLATADAGVGGAPVAGARLRLVVRGLAGVTPQAALEHLAGKSGASSDLDRSRTPVNTLFGYLQIGGHGLEKRKTAAPEV